MKTKQIPEHHQERLKKISTFFRITRLNECTSIMDACDQMDLHKNTLLRVENGNNFTLLTLFEIADYYNISLEDLFWDIK